MTQGSIILLNGTPSSGKTTLARALQDAFPQPVFFQSLDDFRLAVPARFWVGDSQTFRLFGPLLKAWLAMLRDVAVRGIPVVAESVLLDTPTSRELYRDIHSGDLDVLLVGVTCPLSVVRQREAARADRLNGQQEVTAEEVELVHRHTYDLTVDTSSEQTARSVERIIEAWLRVERKAGRAG